MTPALAGGILLIVGAYFMYRGQAMYSILTYALADICWLIISIQVGDIIGGILILIGLVLGILVYIKMNKGIFVKDLHTKEKNE